MKFTPLDNLRKTLGTKEFWLQAALVVVAFIACDLINMGADKLDFIPDAVVPFVGPVVVAAAGLCLAPKYGTPVLVGAIAHTSYTGYELARHQIAPAQGA